PFFTAEVNSCLIEHDTGPCRGYFPKFYYDARTGQCKEFIYGGCQGNGNRFDTKEECLKECSSMQKIEKNIALNNPFFTAEVNSCLMEHDTGPCRGYFPKFYYDAKTGQCTEFIYGGCQGNENRFDTKEECLKECSSMQKIEKNIALNSNVEVLDYINNNDISSISTFDFENSYASIPHGKIIEICDGIYDRYLFNEKIDKSNWLDLFKFNLSENVLYNGLDFYKQIIGILQ
ncbi:thrombin inhibitor hemalin-like, partial [Parasteatoda tepidariorum]|uniref:thrombin inhibitor hemalin-like n=1 Tax=Parasteatoda tepidariorum TaxID=114398 RepID=UPI0039BCBCC1